MDEPTCIETNHTTTLPQIYINTNIISQVADDKRCPSDSMSSPSSRTRRKIKSKSEFSSPTKSARTDSRRLPSTPSSQANRLEWDSSPLISDDLYNEKKERLLKHSKLKEQLKFYFNIDSRKGIIKTEDSNDEDYDTDLDHDRGTPLHTDRYILRRGRRGRDVGLELIVDEKTRQVRDDGIFPEYKKHCRDLKVIPNTYLIRQATEDDFKMRHRYLNPNDCRALSQEIENNLTFKYIDLEDNGMTHKHLQTMKDMLIKNNYINELNISYNNLGPEGARIMKNILLNNSHIVKVNISDCFLGEKAGVHIAEIIENNVFLRELYLRHNKLGNDSAKQIGESLGSNITLELLDVSWNQIGKPGAFALAAGLKANSQLEVLNVAMNGFGEEGGIQLFEVLKNQESLTELDISANRLTDKVARVISTIIPYNRHLRTLKISYNYISAVGALTLLKPYSSRMKKRLACVELEGIDVDAELIDAVNTLQNKRGMTVRISRPPSRRERTGDQLTYSLISVVELMKEYDLDVYDLFPDYEKEKEDMITTDDFISAMKRSDKIPEKRKVQNLKRSIRETRNRNFQLKEFAVLYTQVNRGVDPTSEEPLRSVFAGRKRASTPSSVKKRTQVDNKGQGVRFF